MSNSTALILRKLRFKGLMGDGLGVAKFQLRSFRTLSCKPISRRTETMIEIGFDWRNCTKDFLLSRFLLQRKARSTSDRFSSAFYYISIIVMSRFFRPL